MTRQNRQGRILELIAGGDIGTQAEIADALNEEGYAVTQATVSRDIKELGLIKSITESKTYKYFAPENKDKKAKHINIFRESVVAIEKAMNLIVIKTLTGSANSACVFVDNLQNKDIVGTLAGDDTVLIITKSTDDAEKVFSELQRMYGKRL